MIADVGSDYEENARRQRQALLAIVEGPIAVGLATPDVTEVLVNPDGSVWVDRLFGSLELVSRSFPPARLKAIVNSIASLAGENVADGELQCALAFDGSRVQAVLPPASIGGPTLAIRKHRRQGVDGWPALTLTDYAMPAAYREALDEIISERLNLLVVGSTASGKTTFGGAFLNRITTLCPDDRIITIEDTPELYCVSPCRVQLLETRALSQRRLVKIAMRLRPDRLVMGEVRDAAAIDMLMAAATGHPGFSTIHADTLAQGLSRLRQLTRISGEDTIDPEMISETVHFVLLMRRRPNGPRYVADLAKVVGWRDSRYQLKHVTANSLEMVS